MAGVVTKAVATLRVRAAVITGIAALAVRGAFQELDRTNALERLGAAHAKAAVRVRATVVANVSTVAIPATDDSRYRWTGTL